MRFHRVGKSLEPGSWLQYVSGSGPIDATLHLDNLGTWMETTLPHISITITYTVCPRAFYIVIFVTSKSILFMLLHLLSCNLFVNYVLTCHMLKLE